MQAAFRDLHGARLHGFCLLVAIGDRAQAAAAAADALAAATPRLAELRHPERAAAWLRSAAMRRLAGATRPREDEATRREALRVLGVSAAAFDGLAALDPRERAAFVATAIERLDPIDVETVLRSDEAAARRVAERARRRYLAAAVVTVEREPLPSRGGHAPGALTAQVEALAERALGGAWSSR
jgi:DNA-directed RNA polymerase specialized sigma24 family protein